MYTISHNTKQASSKAREWRSYSSQNALAQLQQKLDMLNKNKAVNKWHRSGSVQTAGSVASKTMYRPQLSNRPTIGGHARNHLKSAHVSNPLPSFKPFFEQEQEHKPRISTNTAKAGDSKVSQANTPLPSSEKPVLGGARFLFMNRSPADLPSTSWVAKNQPQQQQLPPKRETESNVNIEQSVVQKAVPNLAAHMREFGIKKKQLDSSRPSPQQQQQQQTPRRQADRKPKDKDKVRKDRGNNRDENKATPRRPGNKNKGLNNDAGGEDRVRRKKKYKMPKKGREVTLPLTITVDGLAKLLDVPNDHLMRKMEHLGMDKLASDFLLSNEEAAEIALEYEVVPIIPENKGPELYPRPMPEDMSAHPVRSPVVTIMGHVDHGKTTLLDTLRSSSITASEAGGITQHIGAFSVELKSGQHITFLDTPGHAAFSSMRARGANATDIVVLVVAADDGVMPQTKEAIQHANDADVPIIVAVNKCDKPGVDPSKVKEELLQYGIQTEDMGGDVQTVDISALKGTGVEELSENIVTLAEVLDLRAEIDIPVQGTVIESQVERGRGNVASVLVKRGALRIGDVIVAGSAWCKVRNMTNDQGAKVTEAGPASAVKIMGWKELPQAGDMTLQAETEAQAKSVVDNRIEKRKNKQRLASIEAMNEQRREVHERETVERLGEKEYRRAIWEFHKGLRSKYPEPPKQSETAKAQEGEQEVGNSNATSQVLALPMVIKGDVSGTVEAVAGALKKLPSQKIQVQVISSGVGAVTESDVVMVGSSNSEQQGVIVAFNVKADKKTKSIAKREGVDIMPFRVIYKLLEDIEKLLLSRLPPVYVEEVQGEAVVQEVFEITVKGNKTAKIAGGRVTTGALAKTSKMRVKRGDVELFVGEIESLKNVKHDIREATKGQEFGISFGGFEGMREGDILQSLKYREIPNTLL